MLKNPAPKLAPHEYERNFADINPPLSEQAAWIESSRCLFCFDAPCTKACPTHIDVPAFIKKIATKNLRGSARTILESNPLGASCARVCPVEVLCEGACVMGHEHRPIPIGQLQRYAMDSVYSRGIQLFKAGVPNGKRVAIIGAGPAGISCAFYLARAGFAVKILEKAQLAGGLNTYGIAEYKMTRRVAFEEIEMVRQLGVEVETGVEVGADVSLDDLERNYNAIFLGVGMGSTAKLGIPGENLPGVVDALDFIEQVKTREFENIDIGAGVAVIGAGNTAIDCVTQAKRLGAERVMMVYRRSEKEMPAFAYEYELAKKDGVQFMWQTSPARVLGELYVDGLECVRMELGEPDARGRRTPIPVPDSKFILEVDMVIKALGQVPRDTFLSRIPGIEFDSSGRVVINPVTAQTASPKFFAGGDCVNGGREVVDAAQAGKIAAGGIEEYVMRDP